MSVEPVEDLNAMHGNKCQTSCLVEVIRTPWGELLKMVALFCQYSISYTSYYQCFNSVHDGVHGREREHLLPPSIKIVKATSANRIYLFPQCFISYRFKLRTLFPSGESSFIT
jgi:hypothetical protein